MTLKRWYHTSNVLPAVAIVGLVWLSTVRTTNAETGVASDTRAELVIRGVLSQRERLRSGLVRVHGSTLTRIEGEPEIVGPVVSLFAFDFTRGRIRYDDEVPVRVGTIDSGAVIRAGGDAKVAAAAARREMFIARLRYVRNQEYSASWQQAAPSTNNPISLRSPRAPMGGLTAKRHHLWDIRASGLSAFTDIESGGFESGVTVMEICTNLLAIPVVNVTSHGGITEVVLANEIAEHQMPVQEAGFCPIRYVVKSRGDPSIQTSSATWKKIDDVFVPSSVTAELTAEHIGVFCRYSVDYNWESVNRPVDGRYFDYRDFDVPSGVDVVDMRQEPAKQIGVWRGGGTVENIPERTNQPPIKPQPRKTQLVIGGVTCGILFILVYAVWRWNSVKNRRA